MTKKMKIKKEWFEYSTTELYEMLHHFEKMNDEYNAKLIKEELEENHPRGMMGYWLWRSLDGSPSIHNH